MSHNPTLAEKAAQKKEQFNNAIQHWHWVAVFLVLFDVVAVNASYFTALWLRFDGNFDAIPEQYLTDWLHFTPWYTLVCVAVFLVLHL